MPVAIEYDLPIGFTSTVTCFEPISGVDAHIWSSAPQRIKLLQCRGTSGAAIRHRSHHPNLFERGGLRKNEQTQRPCPPACERLGQVYRVLCGWGGLAGKPERSVMIPGVSETIPPTTIKAPSTSSWWRGRNFRWILDRTDKPCWRAGWLQALTVNTINPMVGIAPMREPSTIQRYGSTIGKTKSKSIPKT